MSAECAICCEYLQSHNALSATTCGHVFHHQCLRNWFGRSQTCPQCRCYIREAMFRPLYLSFAADDAATTRNMERRIVELQRKLDTRDAELAANRMTNKELTAKVETQNRRFNEDGSYIDQLRMEFKKLRSQLESKTEDAEMALEWLKAREDKIRHLEDSAKADKNAYEVELEQQHKLIMALTDRCSALEISKRKLEVDLEKRETEMEVQKQQEKLIEELTARCSGLETSSRKLEVDLQKQADEIETQTQRGKLVEELTARCASLETSNRKLEVDLQKQANEIEMQTQQGKLVEELTARCSELETSNRKLESELEKRVNEISILQKSRTIKEEPLSPTDLVSQQREKEIATVPEERAVKEEVVPSIESEQREKKIVTVPEARAVKEESVPSTELKSEQTEKKIATVPEARAVKEEPASSTKLASKPKRAPRKALSAIDLNTDTQATRRKQGHLKRPR